VERWFLLEDTYSHRTSNKVLFQVGYFKENQLGFVLYEGGSVGIKAHYYRDGLNRRWDWGLYSVIIKPDGTCLYYDFSTSKDGTAKPRDFYKAYKF